MSLMITKISVKKINWLKQFSLLQDHKHILLSGKWLDDKLIDASQKILAKQFEHKFVGSGFQEALLGCVEIIKLKLGNSSKFFIVDLIIG